MVMPVCFFILSGLVIMQSLASFRYQAAPFLIARITRIYPVFLVTFAFAVAIRIDDGADQVWLAGRPVPLRLRSLGRRCAVCN